MRQKKHLIKYNTHSWLKTLSKLGIEGEFLNTIKKINLKKFSSVQFSHLVVSDFVTPWTAAHKASLSITNSRSLLQLMYIELVMPSNHLILCCPLFLSLSIFPSIRVFSIESVLCIRWPKYWSFSFSISPSNEHPLGWTGWISLKTKGLSRVFSNTTVQKHQFFGAFFIVQLSYPCMTTGKTIALTRWTFVGKVISLFFNMLSWLVITFLPRSKRLFISWLWSQSAVILEPPKNKVGHCFHCFSIYLHCSDGTWCHDLSFLNVEPTFSLSSFTFIKRLFSSLVYNLFSS